MSSSQDVTAYLYCAESNVEKIKEFFKDYKLLYLKHSGDTKIYLGACPGNVIIDDDEWVGHIKLEFYPGWNTIDWDVNVKFFTALLDNKLCHKIGVAVTYDTGYPHTIYVNEGESDNHFRAWKKYEFKCEDLCIYDGSYYNYLRENNLIEEDEEETDKFLDGFYEEYPGGSRSNYIESKIDSGETDGDEWINI